jgi:NAD(P)H dehydrogenase (quinone)
MPSKNILLVLAHSEPRSLNGALKDLAITTLTAAGHTVTVSDLYAMKWKAVADAGDFTDEPAGDRFYYARSSARGYKGGTQTADIVAEQKKLIAADAVILQFPLWWFSMPAIMKGWIDRVFAYGLAYGIGYEGGRYGTRYGEGSFVGKRALIVTTTGGQATHFTDRGVNGGIEDLLFPLTHGTLFYTGLDVLPVHAINGSNRLTDEQYAIESARYRERLTALFTDAPIPFRKQNGGDYDEALRLKPGVEGTATGLSIHRGD